MHKDIDIENTNKERFTITYIKLWIFLHMLHDIKQIFVLICIYDPDPIRNIQHYLFQDFLEINGMGIRYLFSMNVKIHMLSIISIIQL